MDNKKSQDPIEKYYPILQSVSFLIGLSLSTIVLRKIINKLGGDLDSGFNVYKTIDNSWFIIKNIFPICNVS